MASIPPPLAPRSPAPQQPSGASDDSSEPPPGEDRSESSSVVRSISKVTEDEVPSRQRRSTDVAAPRAYPSQRQQPAAPRSPEAEDDFSEGEFGEEAPAEIFGETRPPRPTEGQPMPMMSYSAPPAPRAPSPSYPAQSSPPPRITQKTMSVPPPPSPGYPSAAQPPADKAAGKPKPEPMQQPVEMAKRPSAPASRFVPFWLTVLILAALIALIAWWLAS